MVYTYPCATCANRRRYGLQGGPRIENERTVSTTEFRISPKIEKFEALHETVNIIDKYSSRNSVMCPMLESLDVISLLWNMQLWKIYGKDIFEKSISTFLDKRKLLKGTRLPLTVLIKSI